MDAKARASVPSGLRLGIERLDWALSRHCVVANSDPELRAALIIWVVGKQLYPDDPKAVTQTQFDVAVRHAANCAVCDVVFAMGGVVACIAGKHAHAKPNPISSARRLRQYVALVVSAT